MGRTLDYFDTDIILDVQAHQGLLQMARSEGDLIVYRKAGGDASNDQTEYHLVNVPEVWTLFDDLSYDLSKLNLKSYAQNSVGMRIAGGV